MQTSTFVESLVTDLSAVGGLGDEAVAEAARRLGPALRSSVALRVLDLMAEVALEISPQLPSGHVEVRLAGQEPTLVFVDDEQEAPAAAPASDDASNARLTLRLPDVLKTGLEAAAAREGVSVNTWIVRALSRSASAPVRRVGRRLTGYAQS